MGIAKKGAPMKPIAIAVAVIVVLVAVWMLRTCPEHEKVAIGSVFHIGDRCK
jgi:hypothetical protein